MGKAEELLLTLSAWEDDLDSPLPEPLAGRVALDALQRIWTAVAPTQSRNEDQPVPGRLLGPDGRYEHAPLRFVVIPAGDLDLIDQAAQLIAVRHPHEAIGDAIAQAAEAERVSEDEVAGWCSRLAAVLGLAWDDDVLTLWRAIDGSHGDVVLTAAGEQAYQRVADRFNSLWTYGSGLSRWLY
jgi:hypothetical protein